MICAMAGCARKEDPVASATETAHQQVAAIKEALPKECQTKAVLEKLKSSDTAIDVVASSCELQRTALKEEKLRWEWSFYGLLFLVLFHVGRKVFTGLK